MATKMISKMVTDRKKTATGLGARLDIHASKATETLHQMLDSYLEEGDVVPDVGMLQRLLGRRLAALEAQLVEADEQHLGEQREDSVLRAARDQAVQDLVNEISPIRFILDKATGMPICKTKLGIEGTLSRDPVVMQTVARRAVKELRKGTLLQGVPLKRSVAVDLQVMAEDLEEPLSRLDEALKQLARDGEETYGAHLAKSEAMVEYDRSYRATARILEDLFRYVGMMDLSEHVRPSRRSGSPDSSEGPESSEGESGEADVESSDSGGTPSRAVLAEKRSDGAGVETGVESRAAPVPSLRDAISEALSS